MVGPLFSPGVSFSLFHYANNGHWFFLKGWPLEPGTRTLTVYPTLEILCWLSSVLPCHMGWRNYLDQAEIPLQNRDTGSVSSYHHSAWNIQDPVILCQMMPNLGPSSVRGSSLGLCSWGREALLVWVFLRWGWGVCPGANCLWQYGRNLGIWCGWS